MQRILSADRDLSSEQKSFSLFGALLKAPRTFFQPNTSITALENFKVFVTCWATFF